jgi:hypothetical protein
VADKPRRPRVSIIERRLQNPFGEPSADIPMKDQGLAPRWFNEASKPGQMARAVELGWEPVTKDMITDLRKVGMYTIGPGDVICRGERQTEHLMFMPKQDRELIQRAKTEENNRRMSNPHAMRNEVLSSYGELDPSGAEQVKATGGVKTVMERIERRPELE